MLLTSSVVVSSAIVVPEAVDDGGDKGTVVSVISNPSISFVDRSSTEIKELPGEIV